MLAREDHLFPTSTSSDYTPVSATWQLGLAIAGPRVKTMHMTVKSKQLHIGSAALHRTQH